MRTGVGAIVLCVLGGAVPCLADHQDSYRKGIEAVDRKRWADVARFMAEAIAAKPAEGERVKIYGVRYEVYLPHFFRGLALARLGDCDAALPALRSSERQGPVKATIHFAALMDEITACEARTPRKAPEPMPSRAAPAPAAPTPDPAVVGRAAKTAEEGIARADEMARAVSRLQDDAALAAAWRQTPALGPAAVEAARTLDAARARLESGRQRSDLGELVEARDLAMQARERYLEVNRSAVDLKQATPRAAPTLPPPPAVSASAAPAAAELMNAAQAYFGGRYEEALRHLAKPPAGKGRTAAQTYLMRAAAHFALYRMGGEKDGELLQRAAADVRACRRTDAALVPDAEAFSPEFIDFFRAQG